MLIFEQVAHFRHSALQGLLVRHSISDEIPLPALEVGTLPAEVAVVGDLDCGSQQILVTLRLIIWHQELATDNSTYCTTWQSRWPKWYRWFVDSWIGRCETQVGLRAFER